MNSEPMFSTLIARITTTHDAGGWFAFGREDMGKDAPSAVWADSKELGQVHEASEELARCAALSKYGISEDEAEEGTLRAGIYPADDFDVSPA